jgi:hypothetical protein
MSQWKRTLAAALILSVPVSVDAAQHPLTPVPDAVYSTEPVYSAEQPHIYEVHSPPAIPLFHRVKYKDLDEMSPCAKPKLIVVRNPCEDACDAPCVAIEICVPTCGCELITVRRNGNRIRYDYGKYAVDVRIKRDHIEVDYQD